LREHRARVNAGGEREKQRDRLPRRLGRDRVHEQDEKEPEQEADDERFHALFLAYFQLRIFPCEIHSTAVSSLRALVSAAFASAIHVTYSFLFV